MLVFAPCRSGFRTRPADIPDDDAPLLLRDWAHPAHVCAGTDAAYPTNVAPGLCSWEAGTGAPPTYTRYLTDSSDDDDETLVALAEELGACGAPESPFRTKPQGLVLHGSHSVTVEKRCHYRVLQSTAEYHRGGFFT